MSQRNSNLLFFAPILIGMILAASCSFSVRINNPKYKIGDCIRMSAMTIDENGEWDSSGHELGAFKIVGIVHTEKMNKYIAKRMHATDYYKIQMVSDFGEEKPYFKNDRFVIPIQDLDNFRYASLWWELPENVKYSCNPYEKNL